MDNTVTPIAVELLEQEADHLRGYEPRDWRGVRFAAVNAELNQLRHQSPLRVWSVTAEWEDEREAEWVRTFAVLAENEPEARTYIRDYIRDSQAVSASGIVVTSALWEGSQAPRIIATLVGDEKADVPGFRWVDSPRSEGESR